MESEIKTIDYNVAEKQKDIIAYENGVFPINISSLKSAVGEFMGGWQNYTHGNFSKDEAAEFIENSIKKSR
ncbi:MAG: hypothetical protein IPL33_01005 [Sphingobacteriales bacterium]|nr:hypothetical protein [Sphingobacteriales bacterium]